MKNRERSFSAAPVIVATVLLPMLGLALGAFTGAGIWIVAVLGGAVIGGLIALAGVGLIAVARSTQEQERDALVDQVTGLPSSEKLSLDLGAVLADRRHPRASLSLYLLEGLKRYNDAYGGACGDALLQWLAHKLGEAVAGQGTVYRMRGGEFAILAHGDEDATTTVRNAAAAALVETGEGFVVASWLGEAILPEEAATVSEALKLVDHRANAHRQAAHGEAAPQLPNELIDAAGLPAPEFDLAELAVAVGKRLQVPIGALDELAAAANLRDVGNMAVPSVVLGRPGELPAEEWRFIRLHTLVGERLLASNFAMDEVARLVRSSHERWDGEGYPDGLNREAIPLGARIVFVCSAFEDMTCSRPHRDALDADAALGELEHAAGSQFDPDVVRAFREAFTASQSRAHQRDQSAFRPQLNVLIADDDPASRFLLCRAVEAAGHECLTAEDGRQAWQLFRSEAPDVVISDSRLPDIDGNELCRLIRREPGYTFFLMINALGDLGGIRRGLGAGADDFLTKPIVRDELEMRLLAAARSIAAHEHSENRIAG
jgi:diguanylate cyclase (GGDEF)-like protein